MSAISLREVQRKLYLQGGREGPPILPHGDDLEALQEQRRARKRRRTSAKGGEVETKIPGNKRKPSVISPLATVGTTTTTPAAVSQASSIAGVQGEQDLDRLFPASDIPEGFPPDLVFRALAAWATIRTLSLKLRFSPCTPVVFLRALHLPVPTRLLGHIHVSLLRLLIPQLQQHYHWGSAMSSHHGSNLRRFPWLPHTKKRKLDGLRWTLRAGDDLEYLDHCTWPIFLDDYAHLTADQLYWSATGPPLDELNRNVDDPKDNPEVWRNLDVSLVPDDWEDPAEDNREQGNPQVPSLSIYYLNDPFSRGDDSDEEALVINDDDDEFDSEVVEEVPRKRKRGRPRKSDPTTVTPMTETPKEMTSGRPEQKHLSAQSASAMPSLATTKEAPHSIPQTQHQGVVTVRPEARTISFSATQPQNQNTSMQQMFSNYWKQEHLKSQLKLASTGTTLPGKPSVMQFQNDMGRRDLPLARVPVIVSKASQGRSKPQKKNPPKLSPEATKLREYMFRSKPTGNDGASENEESVEKLAELTGHTNPDETVEASHSSDNIDSEPPFVWAHFNALKELRSGKAYHQLSVEHKLNILEFLIDEVMMLDIVSNEMAFRFTSKEYCDHPYGVLPMETEFDELENDDQCAVCLGEGDLLCCDGCPSSYHQTCIGMSANEALPEGKWFCPECVLVDPAKFGPLREAPKSSVDWFRVGDVCRSAEHLSSTDGSQQKEEKQYMVVHGFVFYRSSFHESPLRPGTGIAEPKLLSKSDLFNFLTKVGIEDRGSWPLTQIPASDFSCLACPTYLNDASTFDPNVIANKYRLVAPLLAPKRLSASLLKSVEDQCSPLGTFQMSELLSTSMRSDALLVQKQNSPNPPFSEVLLAANFARDIHQKLLKSLLFHVSHYAWATESFLSLLSKASSIDSVCKAIVHLVDAAHPRAFQSEWFESPSHKSSTVTEDREKPSRASLLQDSNASLEKSRRHWQCMLPGSIICDLAKKQTSFDTWIRSAKPELAALTVQKNRRKREKKFITQTSRARINTRDDEKQIQSLEDAKKSDEQITNEINVDNDDGYRFRNRHETTQKPAVSLRETALLVQTEIEREQEKLIAFVLERSKEKWLEDTNWPIAGRRLFEPIGELPKQDIRRLARRAGSVRSPFVLYSFGYEVGQASCYHIWRKHMQSCHTFEDMLLGLRTLETFLDTDVIRQATTQARKCTKKVAPTTDIYCCNTDISSGEHEYLTLDKSGSAGTWKSSRSIEIKSLIPYQFQKVAAIKLERKAILQKRKQESSRKAKTSVVKTSQQMPVRKVAATTAMGSQNDSFFQIFDRHNEEIFRLLMVYANSMGPEYLKARDFIRSETLAKLQTSLGGTRMDMQNMIDNLARAEREFLERQGKNNPAFMRLLKYLYPQGKVAGSYPSSMGNPLGSKMSQVPSLTQSMGGKLRQPSKCGICGEHGHNRLLCPRALSSRPNRNSQSMESFSGSAVDSIAVVTSGDQQPTTSSNQHRTSHESSRTVPSNFIPQRMGLGDWHATTATATHVGNDKNEKYGVGRTVAHHGTASTPVVQRQNFSSINNQGQSGLAMNYQSGPSPSANGMVSIGQSHHSGKSPSVPGGMNFPPNADPLAWNQNSGSQGMPVPMNHGAEPFPSSTAPSDHQRFKFAQNSSQVGMAPNSGRNTQSSTLTRGQNGVTPSHQGWNSQPSGARVLPGMVQRPSGSVGRQTQPPYLYSQNGQANTDPLQYLPQQATTDQRGTGHPSKSSSWYSAPDSLNGFQYTTPPKQPSQMSAQNPQFSKSTAAEATETMNWSQGGNQWQPTGSRQVSRFHNGMPMMQDNFTPQNAGMNPSFDSLLGMQSPSPAATRTQLGPYPQHASAPSSVSRRMTGMSQQPFLGGLEPTPMRTSPQQQQRAMLQGSANHTSHRYPTNDFMLDEDFFSPTPIHPDHELSQSHRHRQHQYHQHQPTGVVQQKNPPPTHPFSHHQQQQQQPQSFPGWNPPARGVERFPPP